MLKGTIGIIGGSGLYKIEGLSHVKEVKVATPFGNPSGVFITGILEDRKVVFLPRHDKGHTILPGEINYRANIYAMKTLGVEQVISVSAVGSLREAMKPLDIVIPDQFVDRTNNARLMTFFGDGLVAHVAFADPVCPVLAKVLVDAARAHGATVHAKGTYINMEGPAFSTRAESKLYRQWGMDIIGMTNMAEAKLAREAEICYATIACVTDYDCWHNEVSVETVTVDLIIQNLLKNVDMAKKVLKSAVPGIPEVRTCACATSLKDAIITQRQDVPAATLKKLEPIVGRYLKP